MGLIRIPDQIETLGLNRSRLPREWIVFGWLREVAKGERETDRRMRGNKRDRSDESNSEGDSDQGSRKVPKVQEEGEYKFFVKFKDKNDKALNPLKLSDEIKNKMGGVLNVRMLRNGNVLVFCKSHGHKTKAMKVRHLLNRPIECFVPGGGGVKGVVYISPEITESALIENIKGAEIESARRFKQDGTAVMLTFKQEIMPERVFLGYMSFTVREYRRPPLRCYKCQRFGHAAAAFRGDRRCGKCGGDHDFKQCQVEKTKCCNCGGKHITSFRGCESHITAVEVEKVRAGKDMSYAEAIRQVKGTGEDSRPVGTSAHPLPGKGDIMRTDEKKSLLAFMVDVVWAARNITKRSDAIKIVVEAAERFLEEVEMGPEELHTFMRQKLEVQERGRERGGRGKGRSEGNGKEGEMDMTEYEET